MSEKIQSILSHMQAMTPKEKQTTVAIAGIFSTRMLGLFMIFPVFALFAKEDFEGITGLQIGLAMGIYGLTQALLQIPYGMLSDRYGRKPLIIAGMLVFMIGSIVCAVAQSIEMMIIGRAIQGMGAVAAVLMATVADNVSEQFRLRAMSIVGITIGLSFTLSLVAGPLLAVWFGMGGIFWAIAILSFLGMLLVIFVLPKVENQVFQREAEVDPAQFKDILKNTQLLRLDFGVFILHAMLTAMFVVVPLMILNTAEMEVLTHWMLYLPVMLLSFVLMVPFIIQAEKKGRMKAIFVGGIGTIALMQFAFMELAAGYWSLFFILLIFFTAFNLLEASLPSLVVKISPADKKGTATGIYSSSQFFGAAVGGVMGGYFYQHFGHDGVFLFTGIIGLIWFVVAMTMKSPKPVSIASVPYSEKTTSESLASIEERFLSYKGVYEVVILPEEKRIYFKIDRSLIDEQDLIDRLERGL